MTFRENTKIQLRYVNTELFLVIANSEYPEMERYDLIRVSLIADNKPITRPEVDFSAQRVSLSNELGVVQFRFESDNILRICGEGKLGLRFAARNLKQFENACPREDGSIEVAFLMLGKLLFVPLKGALYHNAMWNPAKAQAEDFDIVLLPSVENAVFDCAVHEYFSNGVRLEKYAVWDS
jgi:hypothetical protein